MPSSCPQTMFMRPNRSQRASYLPLSETAAMYDSPRVPHDSMTEKMKRLYKISSATMHECAGRIRLLCWQRARDSEVELL